MTEEELIFFQKHQHENISELSLKLPWNSRQKELLQQIVRRQRIQDKLPTFYQNFQIYYPETISLEQCSSEKTAKFRSDHFSGKTLLDLSAGMGVDAFFFSRHFNKSILVEPSMPLASITAHNLNVLLPKAEILMEQGRSAAEFLENYSEKVDLVYLDPSRRNQTGGKIFQLQDCEPNVVQILPRIFEITNRVLIKTSPLLDIKLACKSLLHVKNIFILSIKNECKELLFELEKNYTEESQIHAINLDKNFHFSFWEKDEKQCNAQIGMPLNYLYEPDVSILKAGAFNLVNERYHLQKLHAHSHVYTSAILQEDFPGRIFKIAATLKASKNEIKEYLGAQQKANLTVRNFPASVAELRKKWHLKEGGEDYLFATTLCDDRRAVIACKRVLISN